jgi:hypothetical protein
VNLSNIYQRRGHEMGEWGMWINQNVCKILFFKPAWEINVRKLNIIGSIILKLICNECIMKTWNRCNYLRT